MGDLCYSPIMTHTITFTDDELVTLHTALWDARIEAERQVEKSLACAGTRRYWTTRRRNLDSIAVKVGNANDLAHDDLDASRGGGGRGDREDFHSDG